MFEGSERSGQPDIEIRKRMLGKEETRIVTSAVTLGEVLVRPARGWDRHR